MVLMAKKRHCREYRKAPAMEEKWRRERERERERERGRKEEELNIGWLSNRWRERKRGEREGALF